jgi:hypothetical protein
MFIYSFLLFGASTFSLVHFSKIDDVSLRRLYVYAGFAVSVWIATMMWLWWSLWLHTLKP